MIEIEQIKLRDITLEDLFKIRRWRNEQIKILRGNKLLTEKDQWEYWNKIKSSDQDKLFSIYEKDKLIGYCGLTNIHQDYKKAEISFLLDTKIKESSEKFEEIFTFALNQLITMGFDELKLNRLHVEQYVFRKEVGRILEKVGFEKEGVLQANVIKDGRPIDSVLYAITE